MTPLRIAVVLPTCNRLGMLKRTLRSLEQQEFKDFVIYISDDASKDGTKFLKSSDFPHLNVQIRHGLEAFPSLPDHFNYLFYSVEEEVVAMAHDDEIYHPAWLAQIARSMETEEIVFSYGQTLSVDAKTSEKRFYFPPDGKREGKFTGLELRKLSLKGQVSLPGNGFAIRTRVLTAVKPLTGQYEQFDYEWMIRVADQGMTQIMPDLLQTYTIHASNTVGSRQYLQRFLNQTTSDQMLLEWLALVPDFNADERAAIQERLAHGQAHLDWLMCLRGLGYGEIDLSRELSQRVLSQPKASFVQKLSVRLAFFPGLTICAGYVLGAIFRYRAKRFMLQRPDLTLLSKKDAYKKFPTLMLFES